MPVARFFNDAALEMCGRDNGRLKTLCQVPLQEIDASCVEVSRCMQAGHTGMHIGNHVGPKNLDDPGIVTFLHHCADISFANQPLTHPIFCTSLLYFRNYTAPVFTITKDTLNKWPWW